MLLPAHRVLAEGPLAVAVFPFELVDTSGTTPTPEETARLGRLAPQLRAAIAEADGLAVVDVSPVADEAGRRHLRSCGGCDAKLAREVGADRSVTGTVQKVSNLILNINLYVRDARSGEMLDVMSADIRGNTDESWERGLAWLIRNRLGLQK
jgi:hypothetical protein